MRNRPHHLPSRLVLSLALIRDSPQKTALGPGQVCDLHDHLRQSGQCPQPKGVIVKISARNRLKGKVVEVKKGVTTAHVRLDMNGIIVTALDH